MGKLSRVDADGNRWTPSRTVKVYKLTQPGPKAGRVTTYIAENTRTGASQARSSMSALMHVIDAYEADNQGQPHPLVALILQVRGEIATITADLTARGWFSRGTGSARADRAALSHRLHGMEEAAVLTLTPEQIQSLDLGV